MADDATADKPPGAATQLATRALGGSVSVPNFLLLLVATGGVGSGVAGLSFGGVSAEQLRHELDKRDAAITTQLQDHTHPDMVSESELAPLRRDVRAIRETQIRICVGMQLDCPTPPED